MKKYICILAGAALFAACEQKSETNPPAENKTENNTTVVNPSASPATTEKTETNTTVNTAPSPGSESSSTTTTTTSPAPTP